MKQESGAWATSLDIAATARANQVKILTYQYGFTPTAIYPLDDSHPISKFIRVAFVNMNHWVALVPSTISRQLRATNLKANKEDELHNKHQIELDAS